MYNNLADIAQFPGYRLLNLKGMSNKYHLELMKIYIVNFKLNTLSIKELS